MGLVPPMRGVIDRRILVNFRLDPEPTDALLPDGFSPRTVESTDGPKAIGGICCIRLADMRPRGLPAAIGRTSENAAHRIGVTIERDGVEQSGVYIPRRDTSSRLISTVASGAFGRHEHAEFTVSEGDGRYRLAIDGTDVSMSVTASEAGAIPDDSVFPTVSAASSYHECGSLGYCPTEAGDRLAGVELVTDEWEISPLAVDEVHASYFEDNLPDDAVAFDNALLMRDIGHEWHPRPAVQAAA